MSYTYLLRYELKHTWEIIGNQCFSKVGFNGILMWNVEDVVGSMIKYSQKMSRVGRTISIKFYFHSMIY